MEFFRHSYNIIGSLNERQNCCQQVGEFGFLNTSTNEPPTYEEYHQINTELYWGEDRKNQVVLTCRSNNDQDRYVVKKSNNISPEYQEIFGTWDSGTYGYGIYSEIIFIPLKNNGFFLSNFCIGTFNPTPKLDLSQKNPNNTRYPSFIVGVAPTNNSIVNNYIYISGGGYYGDSSHLPVIDLQNGSVINTKDYKMFDTTNMTCIDINNNVCTLIKMPYNNYFLDNVYLISTAPSTLKSSTFFSFGGRNFFNIIDNIVVELPNN